MANFERVNRLNVTFPRDDIASVQLSGGTYSASLAVESKGGEIVHMNFTTNQQLKTFVEAVMTCAIEAQWDESYPSWFIRIGEDHGHSAENVRQYRPFPEPVEPDMDQL